MADLEVTAPDGTKLDVNVPEGVPEAQYGQFAQQAVEHYTSMPGKLESFGRAAVNNLPAGGQLGALGTAALKGTDYSQGMQEFNQKAAEAKQMHPIAYGAGAVTGSLAPLAIPGVGEAMATAPVALGAALGTANAVGNIDLAQQPQEAVKQGLEGAATGAVLGKILPTGQEAQEGLENFANRKTVEAARLPPGLLNRPKEEIESLGSTMHEMGIDQGPIDQKVQIASQKLKDVGQQIGALGQGLPPLQPEQAESAINQLHDLIQQSHDVLGAGANPEAPLYQAAINKLSQPGMTFEEMQKMKSALGDRAFDAMGNVRNDAAANAYKVYKQAMMDMVQAAPEQYQQLMTQYGDLLDINQALGKTRGQMNAGGIQPKGFGMMGKMGAYVTGGNVPATAGLAAALAPTHPFMALGAATGILNNPEAMSTAARGLSEAAPKLGAGLKLSSVDAVTTYLMKAITQNPQSLGKFAKPLMQAAQTGGAQGLAAQHFLLSQQYPEYNAMMMQQENQ